MADVCDIDYYLCILDNTDRFLGLMAKLPGPTAPPYSGHRIHDTPKQPIRPPARLETQTGFLKSLTVVRLLAQK